MKQNGHQPRAGPKNLGIVRIIFTSVRLSTEPYTPTIEYGGEFYHYRSLYLSQGLYAINHMIWCVRMCRWGVEDKSPSVKWITYVISQADTPWCSDDPGERQNDRWFSN